MTVTLNKKYGNCKVYSPSGELMFLCTESRINWYLNKNLAEIINTDPILEAKLNFQPKGLGYANQDSFYFHPREDKCVVCGTTDVNVLTRHHIVPYCYRRWMPIEYKSHNCYDIVKLCRTCHNNYEIEAQQLKFEIAEKFGITINKANRVSTIKGSANTLLNHIEYLPDDVFNRMYSEISEYLNKEYLSDEDLEYIMNMNYTDDPIWKSWGLECVEKIDDLDSFVKMWRKHFIEKLNPPYMPTGWEINREISRKRLKK